MVAAGRWGEEKDAFRGRGPEHQKFDRAETRGSINVSRDKVEKVRRGDDLPPGG